jgi:hypothetical protein
VVCPPFEGKKKMIEAKDIDTIRLVGDLRAAAAEARELKRALGATWQRPMAAEQRALAELRRHATRLCVLRAFLRGKWHVTKAPRDGVSPLEEWNAAEWHARVAERAARQYQRVTARAG